MVTLRRATPDDAELLRGWDPFGTEPGGDWVWEAEFARHPDWREHLMAEVGGRSVGFLQIIDPALEDSHYWGQVSANLRAIDIWIGAEADRNQGHGTRMMHLALERCFADAAVTAVLIDPHAANTRAHRFYERFGFKVVGPRRFGDDECLVYRLERVDYAAR